MSIKQMIKEVSEGALPELSLDNALNKDISVQTFFDSSGSLRFSSIKGVQYRNISESMLDIMAVSEAFMKDQDLNELLSNYKGNLLELHAKVMSRYGYLMKTHEVRNKMQIKDNE